MKKSLSSIILAVMCCLAACSPKEQANNESSSYSSQESQSVQIPQGWTKIPAPYMAENLIQLSFIDVEKTLTVDMSANSYLQNLLLGVEYYVDASAEQVDLTEVKYILSMRGMQVQIGASGAVCFLFDDETKKQASVLKDEFSYLDTLTDGKVLSVDGYTAAHNIEVLNAENKGGAVKDKEDFLNKLQNVRLIKLNDKAHYQTGAVKYTLQMGNDEIVVYENHVMWKGQLYTIYQGSFDFLADVEYSSSSGWLPWL